MVLLKWTNEYRRLGILRLAPSHCTWNGDNEREICSTWLEEKYGGSIRELLILEDYLKCVEIQWLPMVYESI